MNCLHKDGSNRDPAMAGFRKPNKLIPAHILTSPPVSPSPQMWRGGLSGRGFLLPSLEGREEGRVMNLHHQQTVCGSKTSATQAPLVDSSIFLSERLRHFGATMLIWLLTLRFFVSIPHFLS